MPEVCCLADVLHISGQIAMLEGPQRECQHKRQVITLLLGAYLLICVSLVLASAVAVDRAQEETFRTTLLVSSHTDFCTVLNSTTAIIKL